MSDFIVLPAYNEGSRIQPILKQIKKITKNIIVVDDGSKDNTVGLVKQLGITVLEHGMNLGKGAALRTGCEYAVQQGAKNIVVIFAKESPANDGYEGGQHLLYKNIGSGEMLFFKNGQVVKGTWNKETEEDNIKFFDSSDKEISIVRGLVFVEMLPIGNKVTY